MASLKMGTRYECSNRDNLATGSIHGSGTGKPRTGKCPNCGSAWVIQAGRWGIFEWRGDNRYPLDLAIETTHSLKIAERWVEQNTPRDGSLNVVTRWLPEECFA